jgi:CheY-like chemotaxis protein
VADDHRTVPRVLLADVKEDFSSIAQILEPDATVVRASTLDEALGAVTTGVDLVLCGIHFDDSRMFDLLRYVKADPTMRGVPFLCFRDRASELAPTLFESLDIACRALGGVGFVDLIGLRRRVGEAQGDAEFRALVLRHARGE